MRISDWSSDVCSSDLKNPAVRTVVNKVKTSNRIAAQSSVLHFGGCLDVVLRSPTSRTNFGRSRWNCWLVKMIFMWSCGRAELGSGSISGMRSEEQSSELQSLMRISYAVFCLKKKNTQN